LALSNSSSMVQDATKCPHRHTATQRGEWVQTNLLIPKLNQPFLVRDDLIPLAHALLEELRQREPLPGHLIPVVGVHKLVVVDAVWGIAFDALNGGLAAVEGEDVVDEGLACGGEGERFGGVGGVVVVGVGLADFEVLAGEGGGEVGGGDGGRHCGG